MQGINTIHLNEQCVSEAVADYLNKHSAPGIIYRVTNWKVISGEIEADFETVTGNGETSTQP